MVALRFRLLLLLAAALCFGGSVWAPFVFDDLSMASNAALQSASGWREALDWTNTRPLAWLTFWLNFRLSPEPGSFHLVNLLLHLACVWLASLAFEELLPRRAALIAGFLVAAHPLLSEAVLYVSARPTLLATLFCLAALLLWRRELRWASVGAFAAAVLSKEEALAFPLFLALIEWSTRRAKAALWPLAAMGMLALAGGLRSLAAAAGGPGIGPIDYFCYQGVAILRYIWLLMVPLGLTVDPDIRVAPLAAALAWGVISVVILLLPGRTDIRSPGMWLAGGLLLLLPTSSIFPAADLAADRRMYLPMMAFAPLAGLLLARVPRRLLAAFALVFCLMAWSRTRVWQDPQSLWMEAARLAPDKIRPKRQLARLLPPAQAVEMLEDASSKAPEDAALAGDLGSALLQAGRPDQALNVYDRMLALDPHSAAAMTGRGVALAALGQRAAAQGEFERVLQTDPCHFDARINLARLGTDRPAPVGCAFTPGQYQALAQAAISEP